MNWSEQMDSMMKNWSAMQKKAWDDFFATMQGYNQSQTGRMWETTLSMGESMMKEMFKMQSDWLAAWVDGLSKMPNMPEQALQSARQFQEMASRWNKTQADMLETWLGMMKKFTPKSPTDAWTEMPQTMFKTWQDATQNIMDTQMKWMNSFMSQAGKPRNE